MRLLLEIGPDAPLEKAEEVVRAEAGAQGEDSGLRPSRVPHRGSARDAPAADVARSRPARRTADLVRDVAADRGARQEREEAESRTSTSIRRRPTTRSASTSICSRRSSRSAASRAGRRTSSSSAEQPPDPPARRIHRSRVSAAVRAGGSPMTARSTITHAPGIRLEHCSTQHSAPGTALGTRHEHPALST